MNCQEHDYHRWVDSHENTNGMNGFNAIGKMKVSVWKANFEIGFGWGAIVGRSADKNNCNKEMIECVFRLIRWMKSKSFFNRVYEMFF